MPYTDDPIHVPADAVRFLLGDTDAAKPRLTDNEVDYLLVQEGNPLRAAARGAEMLVGKYSSIAETKRVGPLTITHGSSLASKFAALARALWRRAVIGDAAPYAGGISVSDKRLRELDTDRTRSFARKSIQTYAPGEPQSLTPEEILSSSEIRP